jgi:hypothetical protein
MDLANIKQNLSFVESIDETQLLNYGLICLNKLQ